MKKMILLFAVVLTGISSAFSHQLPPGQWRPLTEHLAEVNKEWLRQSVEWPELQYLTRFDNDNQRIQTHLRLVEKILRERKNPDLTPAQQMNRLRRLDELQAYWQAGVFPENTYHPVRQPYFVDLHETACAVGYLMLQSGGEQTVRQISKEKNFAYVRELAANPGLASWAETNGFTVDELAWIQPGYPPAAQEMCAVGNGGGANGTIHVLYKNPNLIMPLIVAGNFTEIDGVAANSIVSWNGNEWKTYGNGIIGDVYCVAQHSNIVFAGGNFTLSGMNEPVNIAYWHDGQWYPMQVGDMQGSVRALELSGTELIVGGDFKKIDGLDIPYLIRWHRTTQTWHTDGKLNGVTTDGVFSVDAPVSSFAKNDDHLLIGGEFTTLMPNGSSPMPTQYIAYWNTFYKIWESTFNGPYQPVRSCSVFYGYLAVGGDFNQPPGFAYLDAGLWDLGYIYLVPKGDGIVHGFLEHNDRLIMYGGFTNNYLDDPFITGIRELFYENHYSTPLIGFWTNNTVRAAASYDGYAYFAGDFTEVNGQPFNGLFCSPLTGVTSTQETENQDLVNIFYSNGYLNLRCENLPAEATLMMYSLQGQLLKEVKLSPGEVNMQLPLSDIPGGVYFYQLQGKNLAQAGKFVK